MTMIRPTLGSSLFHRVSKSNGWERFPLECPTKADFADEAEHQISRDSSEDVLATEAGQQALQNVREYLQRSAAEIGRRDVSYDYPSMYVYYDKFRAQGDVYYGGVHSSSDGCCIDASCF